MKQYKIVFSPLALTDIEQIVIYYNKQQKGLGKRFVKQIKLTLADITINPFFTNVRYEDIHCARVSKFPFLVHYKIEPLTFIVIIAAVYSTSQQPLWE